MDLKNFTSMKGHGNNGNYLLTYCSPGGKQSKLWSHMINTKLTFMACFWHVERVVLERSRNDSARRELERPGRKSFPEKYCAKRVLVLWSLFVCHASDCLRGLNERRLKGLSLLFSELLQRHWKGYFAVFVSLICAFNFDCFPPEVNSQWCLYNTPVKIWLAVQHMPRVLHADPTLIGW